MKLFPTTRNCKRPVFQVLVAGMCIALILVLGTVQLLHTHNSNEAAKAGCSLCAIVHLSALPIPVLSPAISIQLTLLLQQPTAAHAPPRFQASPRSIRPPPVPTAHS